MLLTEYLDLKNIPYWTQGKNISQGWIGLRCIFCQDRSNHLGIHLESGTMKCWLCGRRGHFRNLIYEIEPNYGIAKQIASEIEFGTFMGHVRESFVPLPEIEFKKLVSRFIAPLPKRHREYLEGRGFDPYFLERKYGLLASDHVGEMNFRVIFPITIQKRLVSLIGRDITEKSKLKYKILKDKESLLERRKIVYNIDNVKGDSAIVVEGVLDAIRIGDGAIATLTTAFSKSQVEEIKSLKLRKCFCMYDGEENAISQAERLAYMLSPFIEHVEVIELDEGKDPGDFTESEVRALRRELL